MEAVHWADVFAGRESELISGSIKPYRLRYQHLRQYVIHNLADAVATNPWKPRIRIMRPFIGPSVKPHRLALAAQAPGSIMRDFS